MTSDLKRTMFGPSFANVKDKRGTKERPPDPEGYFVKRLTESVSIFLSFRLAGGLSFVPLLSFTLAKLGPLMVQTWSS